MSKQSITTGAAGELVHTRSTAGSEESQASVLGIDGSDGVVPADATKGLSVFQTQGPSSASNPKSASSIGVASSNPVAAKSDRTKLELTNSSTSADIWIAYGTTAIVGSGTLIGPRQTIEILGIHWTGRVDAIATAAATNLGIAEM